ncbi:hypothetical protein BGW39_000237 [Mortierella sp. 14UC]|nr:hypothetical protein BGW39_000237 [Mortierella sp. 14UC]
MQTQTAPTSSASSTSSSRTTTATTPILISGAGPVGLFQALLLLKLGLPFRIIEREPAISPLSKALGLHARSMEIFRFSGILDRFLEQGRPLTSFSMHAGGRTVGTLPVMGTSTEDTEFNYGLFLEQERTSVLLKEMVEEMGVKVEYGWELLDTKVVEAEGEEKEAYVETVIRRALSGDNTNPEDNLMIGGVEMYAEQEDKEYEVQTVRSKYLIACDGGRSTVRHKLNIGFSGRTLGHKTLMADQFVYKNRIFLAGDAAHIHSPAGGQGLNTGLQDAHNLAWKLAFVVNGLMKDGEGEVLETYREREDMADRAIAVSSMLLEQNRDSRLIARFVRRALFTVGPYIAKVFKSFSLASDVSMLKVRYQENILNRPHASQPAPLPDYQVGVRAQDGLISPLLSSSPSPSSSSSTLRLHELFIGIARFHILVFASTTQTLTPATVAHATRFISQWRHKWTYASSLQDGYADKDLFKFHFLTPPCSSSSNNEVLQGLSKNEIGEGKVFLDEGGKLHKKYGFTPFKSDDEGAGGIVVLRPDSHIGYRVHGLEEQTWKDADQYLSSVLTAQVE